MFGETVRRGMRLWVRRRAEGPGRLLVTPPSTGFHRHGRTPSRDWCEVVGAHWLVRPKRPVVPPRDMGFSPRTCTSGSASQAATSRRVANSGLSGANSIGWRGGRYRPRCRARGGPKSRSAGRPRAAWVQRGRAFDFGRRLQRRRGGACRRRDRARRPWPWRSYRASRAPPGWNRRGGHGAERGKDLVGTGGREIRQRVHAMATEGVRTKAFGVSTHEVNRYLYQLTRGNCQKFDGDICRPRCLPSACPTLPGCPQWVDFCRSGYRPVYHRGGQSPSPTYALAAFCAASNTSRADVVPATCSVPSAPMSIHPAFTA